MISQMADFTSSRAFRVAGAAAFAESGITHADVDHLMIYDAFAHLPLYGLEDLGFVGRGESAAFIREGHTRPGGKLPMNTNGGGLSLHALGHVWQCTHCKKACGKCAARHRHKCPVQRSRCATVWAACSQPAGTIIFSNQLP